VHEEVAIRGDMIRLGQLLKLAGVADDGSVAKSLIANGLVSVNDEPETRRGRQLHPGDRVRVGDAELSIVAG
jgi:ribosome-associated protein